MGPSILDCCPDGAGEVSAVQIKPDGTIIASASTSENIIRLWDAQSGLLVRTMDGHTGPVRALCFSADNDWLVSGSDDKTARLWDVKRPVFTEGQSVEAPRNDSSRYFKGRIDKAWGDGTYKIEYLDNGYEYGLAAELIRVFEEGKAPAPDTVKKASVFREGQGVEVRFNGEHWYYKGRGRITRVNGDSTCDIEYSDGRHETGVSADMVHPLDKGDLFDEGQQVEVLLGWRYFKARITKVCPTSTYDISFSDTDRYGTQEDLVKGISAKRVRALDGGENGFMEGQDVEAQRFAGKSTYYRGNISRVNYIFAYDVEYSDGNRETDVQAKRILALKSEDSIIDSVRDVRIFAGHTDSVIALDISVDGKRLVSASASKEVHWQIKIWEMATGQVLTTFCDHNSEFLKLLRHNHSYDDRRPIRYRSSLSRSDLHETCLDDLDFGIYLHFSPPAGDRLMVVTRCGTPKVYDVTQGQALRPNFGFDYSHAFSSIAGWSPIGDRILAGRRDGSIEMLDGETGETIWLGGDGAHESPVTFIQFCAQGNQIISASEKDGILKVWGAQLGIVINDLESQCWSLKSVHMSATLGNRFVCLSGDLHQVQLWTMGCALVLPASIIETCDGFPATCMHISSEDCSRMASGTQDGTIHIWDISTGMRLATIEDWSSRCGESSSSAHILAVQLSEDGACVAASSSDGTLAVWDVKEDMTLLRHSLQCQSPEGAVVLYLFMSPKDRLISGSRDGLVKVWSTATGRLLLTLEGHTSWARTVTESQDGTRIACGGRDGTINVWDAQTGASLHRFDCGNEGVVTALLFNSDLDRLYAGEDSGHVITWDLIGGQMVKSSFQEVGGVTSLSRTSEGRLFMSSHTSTAEKEDIASHLQMFDGRTGESMRCMEYPLCQLLAARRDVTSTRIVCGMADGRIKLLYCPEGLYGVSHFYDMLRYDQDWNPIICERLKSRWAFQTDEKGNNVMQEVLSRWTNFWREQQVLPVLLEENPLIALVSLVSANSPLERHNLLSLAVDNQCVSAMRTIITTISVALLDENYIFMSPAGMPYHNASDFQKALLAYPREAIEAIEGLWGLYRVSKGSILLKPRSRILRGTPIAIYTPLYKILDIEDGEEYARQHSLWSRLIKMCKEKLPVERYERFLACCSSLWSRLVTICKRRKSIKPAPSGTVDSPVTGAGDADGSSSTKQSSTARCLAWVWKVLKCFSLSRKTANTTPDMPMVDWVLPIPGLCAMGPDSFLATCVHVAERLDDTAIFEKQAVQILMEYKWESYARAYFLTLWAVSLALAINFSLYTFYNDQLSLPCRLIWLICLAINLLPLLLQEASQICVMRKASCRGTPDKETDSSICWAFTRYISSIWNMVDAFTYLGLVVTIILRFTQPFGKPCYIISAAVSLLLWLKLLYYFRGFQSTGVLVRAVMQITRDIRFFLVILLVFILGFGNAFYLLSQVDVRHGSSADDSMREAFGSAQGTFKSLFEAMTGGYDLNLFSASSLGLLPSIMYFFYVVVQAIIMLNLLIAIMGDSYDRVQEKAVGEWRCEQAKIILELEQVLPLVLGKARLGQWQMPWLHVLMEEGKEPGGGEDDWAGRVRTVVRGVSAQTKSEIEEVKSLVKSEVAAIQTEVAAIRSESSVIRADLAELKGLASSVAELRGLVKSVAEAVNDIQSRLKD